jgi:serine/threonine protein phosphatase PrpC
LVKKSMESDTLTDTVDLLPPEDQSSVRASRPRSRLVSVDVAALSHRGKVRPNNEDNFLVVRFGRFLETLSTSLPDGQIPAEFGDTGYGMVVADGMGGMAGGEVASQLAITLLLTLVLDTPDWIMGRDEADVLEVIRRAGSRFGAVNEAIIEEARRRPRLAGMGTTLTMAASLGADLVIAHVGDSPVYLFRGGKLRKLTRDHTVAQELADEANIHVDEVPARFRHVLTHAIGIEETGSDPDIGRFHLIDGDCLLLCTDGLTDMADEAAIARELKGADSASAACKALVDLALKGGGKDNVTVVVARYEIPSA